MAQQLQELLKEDQEPFHLQNYLANLRSQYPIQLKKRKPIIPETSIKRTTLCKHACFLSFQNSPDVRKSPLIYFNSPSKSPIAAIYLRIPSKTAAILSEAAIRIHKQQAPKSNKNSLFGSFLKKLKLRSKNKKRPIQNHDNNDRIKEESTSSSCSDCADVNIDFNFSESQFCVSPFQFSLENSPSPAGIRTPGLCSPVVSPDGPLRKGKDNFEEQYLNNVQVEDEKEQSSPVSVLDPAFEDEREIEEFDENEDYELESNYGNILKAKQQLLDRLRRFEKLAELDPMELERSFLEGSHSDDHESDNDEPVSFDKNHNVETSVTNALSQQSVRKKLSTDTERLVSDLMEKSDVRIRKKFDLRKEMEFDTIDMMLELDLNKDADAWRKFIEGRDDTLADIEFAVFVQLLEELSEELECQLLQQC